MLLLWPYEYGMVIEYRKLNPFMLLLWPYEYSMMIEYENSIILCSCYSLMNMV
jgi:hypothetical protein